MIEALQLTTFKPHLTSLPLQNPPSIISPVKFSVLWQGYHSFPLSDILCNKMGEIHE